LHGELENNGQPTAGPDKIGKAFASPARVGEKVTNRK